jgi:hypothetical protein
VSISLRDGYQELFLYAKSVGVRRPCLKHDQKEMVVVLLEQIYFPDDITKFDEAYLEKVEEKNVNQTEHMD